MRKVIFISLVSFIFGSAMSQTTFDRHVCGVPYKINQLNLGASWGDYG